LFLWIFDMLHLYRVGS